MVVLLAKFAKLDTGNYKSPSDKFLICTLLGICVFNSIVFVRVGETPTIRPPKRYPPRRMGHDVVLVVRGAGRKGDIIW